MSKLTVHERACLYAAKCPAAVAGAGGHNATFTVACALVKGFDMSIDAARPVLAEFNARCEPAWTAAELEHKLRQADTVPDEKPRGWLRDAEGVRDDGPNEPRQASHAPSAPLPPAVQPKPAFHADRLRAFAARWRGFIDTAWLAERSPENPYGISADAFLRAAFREGEKVVVFTNQQSQGQAIWPLQVMPERGDDGVWYLAQPVDGREHENPRAKKNDDGTPKLSRRSEESVTDWRHLVLESDAADAKDWMAALVQLPLRVVAIYTSGGRSIHALVRVDAKSKQDWDNVVKQIRPILVTLGADPKAMSAVRLTRLPGCWRGEKLQKLLYLAPDPGPEPLTGLPKLRDVLSEALRILRPCLAATKAEVEEQVGWEVIDEIEKRLAWFESAPAAKAALAELRAWRGGG